jgi:hypothetical protein
MTAVVIDVEVVSTATDRLRTAGSELAVATVRLDVPGPVPEDEHGVQRSCGRFDEAWQGYEHRLADEVRRAGERMALQVLQTAQADSQEPFLHLPAAGRVQP